MKNTLIYLSCFFLSSFCGVSQDFLTGADMSYTSEILKNGGIYYDDKGAEVDPYGYFASRGSKVVRLRLWHTPTNNIDVCGSPILSGSLEDILDVAQRVKSLNQQLMLSIHYSDYFADPSKQKMPQAWEDTSESELLDSIQNYTQKVLDNLKKQNTVPDIVSIGNETTWGFIDRTATTDGFDWSVDGAKYNAALATIDEFNLMNSTTIKKAIHFTESSALWATQVFKSNGVHNFDMIGVSYYPYFSPNVDIPTIGEVVHDLISDYEKEVMIFETGFAWTYGFSDDYSNFINNNGNTVPYPMTEDGQLDFLLSLSETVKENGGSGVIYWEPSWISSLLCDKWGQGSSYENVAMYNLEDNRPLSSFDFFQYGEVTQSDNPKYKDDFLIYPNPVMSDRVILGNIENEYNWELIDLSGRIVLFGSSNGNNTNEISLETLPQGVYVLKLVTDQDEIMVKKLFK